MRQSYHERRTKRKDFLAGEKVNRRDENCLFLYNLEEIVDCSCSKKLGFFDQNIISLSKKEKKRRKV